MSQPPAAMANYIQAKMPGRVQRKFRGSFSSLFNAARNLPQLKDIKLDVLSSRCLHSFTPKFLSG